MSSVFLKAEWRKLILANFEVDPAILLPYLPYKTELEHWNGKYFVSLVGFRFVNTTVKGIPIPLHRHFEEINLRFYVKHSTPPELRRGVTFIKEIGPKPALSAVANIFFNENYVTMPTRHEWQLKDDLLTVAYYWKPGQKWNSLSVHADSSPNVLLPNSSEEFLTKQFWGYTHIYKNLSSEYEVEHPSWIMYDVKEYIIDVEFEKLYGPEFGFLKSQKPFSVLLAEGSDIVVRTRKKIK